MAERPLPSSFDTDAEYQETAWQKVGRKLREEPLIPLGTGLTCLALYNAWRAMRRGDHAGVQRMFRARIGAQAFTIIAVVAGGAYYGADREKRRELIKLEAQQRAEERNQRWLRELEVRDEEDKKLQVALKRKRDRLEQKRAADQEKEKEKEEEKEEDGGKQQQQQQQDPKIDTAGKTADAAATEAGSNGSAVLSALSNTGGWFGAKKGSTEPSTTDAGTSKKGSVEQTKIDTETPKRGSAEQSKTETETPKK